MLLYVGTYIFMTRSPITAHCRAPWPTVAHRSGLSLLYRDLQSARVDLILEFHYAINILLYRRYQGSNFPIIPYAMTSIIAIEGGHDVSGDIHVSGSKNAGLALMAASLLASGKSTLEGIPPVSDIDSMGRICQYLGANITYTSDSLRIDTMNLGSLNVPDRLTRSLRAPILTLGPLIARFGFVNFCLPGGCSIGTRPIEEHLRGLEKMGACIKASEGSVEANAPSGLHGATIYMQTPSVTGTMNLMMAACLASGVTYIYNSAREPEVTDLAHCLISMGAILQEGDGPDPITIFGCDKPLLPRFGLP